MVENSLERKTRRMKRAFERGMLDDKEAANAIIDELAIMRAEQVYSINRMLEVLPTPVLRQVIRWAFETSPWPNVPRHEVFYERIKQHAEQVLRRRIGE